MHSASLLFSILAATTPVLSQEPPEGEYPSHRLYQLDGGHQIENIAARQSSHILMTLSDVPEVFEVDPTHQHGNPRSIHTFEGATKLSGISEVSPDQFVVLVGKKVDGVDTVSLWTLNRNESAPDFPAAEVIEKIGEATSLNGLTTLSPTVVLASDSEAGAVYKLDLEVGTAGIVLEDATMKPGINGIRYRESFLYYTNTEQKLFARIPIDPATAKPTGDAEVLADTFEAPDDFALAGFTDDAFVVDFGRNSLVRVGKEKSEVVVSDIPAPRSAQFGASGNTLYVVTSGTGEGHNGAASVFSVAVPGEAQ